MIQPTNDPLSLIADDAEDCRNRVVMIHSYARHLKGNELFGHMRSRFMSARSQLQSVAPVDLQYQPETVAKICRAEAASLLWAARQLEERAKGST